MISLSNMLILGVEGGLTPSPAMQCEEGKRTDFNLQITCLSFLTKTLAYHQVDQICMRMMVTVAWDDVEHKSQTHTSKYSLIRMNM